MPEHRYWYPFCPFVLGQHVGNIPLGEETEQQNISEKEVQTEEDCQTEEPSGATASAVETQSEQRREHEERELPALGQVKLGIELWEEKEP